MMLRAVVAGAIGPTNRTGSISPDVTDPGARNVTFVELSTAYAEQVMYVVAMMMVTVLVVMVTAAMIM